MDFSESMKIVSSRIQEIEPEHASKIVGYLLLQECGNQDMIRLAFSPDNVIKTVANKVKYLLGFSSPSHNQLTYSPTSPRPYNIDTISDLPAHFNPFRPPSHSRAFSSSNISLPPLSPCWNNTRVINDQDGNEVELIHQPFLDPFPQGYSLDDHFQQVLSLDDHLDSASYHNSEIGLDGLSRPRVGSRRSHSSTEFFPQRVCHYFSKGFCKHGTNCRFFHSNPTTLGMFSQLLSLGCSENGSENEDHHAITPRSLEKLETEITELLRLRNGSPVSIASLPMMYYEKYGRTLQAEGYLSESQRHGKVGYSLTKLLARMKNSIRLIDRPHGQHSVILAEDAQKYSDFACDRVEHGGSVPGSRQIYLTFPAESTFTERDVSTYFNTYGPVQDVRIPCQDKRMFGFVTFVYSETVRKILAKGNPHFVCGARVLVKPYREKSRLSDRKLRHTIHYESQLLDGESEFYSVTRSSCDNSRLIRKQLLEEHKEVLELEKKRLSESQLVPPKQSMQLQYFANSVDELKLLEDDAENAKFPTSEQFDLGLKLNNGPPDEEKLRSVTTSYSDQDSSQGLNLPDSPFSTSIANSISKII